MTITTLLVANRGEIARRVMRSAHAMGVRCVAVYVVADAGAPYVGEADVAVALASSYLDSEALLAIAKSTNADAVHPGYGFLAENAEFATQVEAAGLTWVGPPPRVIAALGDKLEAKRLAGDAGLPVLPSSEDPKDAKSIGYPLIVKATAGGGGKGVHVVTEASQLDEALATARREAQSSFGDDRVFLERYLARSRHVEIQILADRHGNVVHFGERDCSVQRRHQKLIEESPSPAVDDALRHALGEAALVLARAVGYESAGTVEFLVDDATHDFYFLEVNTRLQVEHPVSEEVAGVDLVREQLRVAQGELLGYDPSNVRLVGHAIEARLCAEDPAKGFLPSSGRLAAFEPANQPPVRWESGVEPGSVVTAAFDPLLAKVIAHAPTRGEAASALALALERLHVGGVMTNRDFLAATLRSDDFLAGDTTTDFIDRHEPLRARTLSQDEVAWAAVAGVLWLQGERRASAPVLRDVPSGWRNARLPRQRTSLRHGDSQYDVEYTSRRDDTFDVGERGSARIHAWSASAIDVEINELRRLSRVTKWFDHLYVQALRGTADFVVVPRFEVRHALVEAGGLNAPMSGLVLDVRVDVGERVVAGQTLVVMEAMKMEHVVSAPSAGTVREVLVQKGQQVDGGAALLSIDPDGPTSN